jgi:hypothetical protein
LDLATITEGVHQVTLGETSYEVRLLKLREWGRLQSWLKQAVPSPLAEAARALNALKASGETIAPDVRQAILDHAQEAARLWPPRVGSIAWVEALDSTEGGTARFLAEALRAAGHQVDDDEAAELEARASVDQIANVFRICLHGEPSLPKSTTAPTDAGPETKLIKKRSFTTWKGTIGVSSSTRSRKRRAGRTPKSASSPCPS